MIDLSRCGVCGVELNPGRWCPVCCGYCCPEDSALMGAEFVGSPVFVCMVCGQVWIKSLPRWNVPISWERRRAEGGRGE